MNILVIYPGRFHPFHKGHKGVFQHLTKKFGENNVYVATSDVQNAEDSPFSFSDKVEMMTKMGIPVGKIAHVKNPYRADEIVKEVPNPDDTALIFAVGAKDMEGDKPRFSFKPKKDGSPSYMQPLPADLKQLKPLTEHAYVDVIPTVNFKVGGVDANSASAIRDLYNNANEAGREQIITDLYGGPDAGIKSIYDQRLVKQVENPQSKPLTPAEQKIQKLKESIAYLKAKILHDKDYAKEKFR